MTFYRIDEDERKARSERAKEMHQEIVVDESTGLERRKFGGVQPRSGRPRKVRMSEIIADRAVGEANEYFERMDGIVKAGTDGNAIAALRTLREFEETERAIAAKEEEDYNKMQRDELLSLVISKFMSLEGTGALDYIDAPESDVKEIE